MNKPVLGVLGGVGPLATAYFLKLLIERTPANSDQEHIPVVVINDPQIPDRTAFILDRLAPDPLPEMVGVARRLETFGVDYIAVPCNTAHYFYDALMHAVEIPVLNIVEETATTIAAHVGTPAKVGVMATEGTIASGVYKMWFEPLGIEVVAPGRDDQEVLDRLIYEQVKANQPYDEQDLVRVAQHLFDEGCAAVVVGCTELSVVFQGMANPPENVYDSLAILADRCIQWHLDGRDHGNA